MYREWIKNGTMKPGKTRAGLAAYITKALKLDPPMSRTTIYKIIAGTREIHADELEPAAAYMEEPIPRVSELIVQAEHVTVDIVGSVMVGSWSDSEIITEKLGQIAAPRDHQFPTAKHLAYLVKDDSMDALKISEGAIILCVDFKDTKLKLATSMKVVIERRHGQLVERSLRAVEVHDNKDVEFKSLCTSREYKSVFVKHGNSTGGEKVTVVGLLRRSIREFL